MPVYKDEKSNTWYSKFYYTDWKGDKKAKLKRGFAKQRDAKEWERSFMDKFQENPQMTFASLVDLYLSDMSNRLRQSTMNNKTNMINTKVLPYFGKTPIGNITSARVRQWQNELIGKGFEATYLKAIHNKLSAIFNYAVKYYSLKENPCHKSGSMGRKHAKDMQFWTRDEYLEFIKAIKDKPQAHAAFQVLYWCGVREGELLALTREDIDFTGKTISINKSYQRLERKDIITEPKTPKSNRIIAIPDSLCNELRAYIDKLYGDGPNGRIFPVTKHFLWHEMVRGCKSSGIKKIRVHDLRHSHASLLIELGFSPVFIAERLGHENIETTLNTYSHLYPHKQTELAAKLESIGF